MTTSLHMTWPKTWAGLNTSRPSGSIYYETTFTLLHCINRHLPALRLTVRRHSYTSSTQPTNCMWWLQHTLPLMPWTSPWQKAYWWVSSRNSIPWARRIDGLLMMEVRMNQSCSFRSIDILHWYNWHWYLSLISFIDIDIVKLVFTITPSPCHLRHYTV